MKFNVRIKILPGKKPEQKANEDRVKAALAWGAARATAYIRRQIFLQQPFQIRTGKAAFLWFARSDGNTIRVVNPVPYVRHLNYGWQSQQMTWLLGKTIPLDGGLTFRKVTQKSLDQGKWMRPARPPTYFLENAMNALISDMEEAFPGLQFTLILARTPRVRISSGVNRPIRITALGFLV